MREGGADHVGCLLLLSVGSYWGPWNHYEVNVSTSHGFNTCLLDSWVIDAGKDDKDEVGAGGEEDDCDLDEQVGLVGRVPEAAVVLGGAVTALLEVITAAAPTAASTTNRAWVNRTIIGNDERGKGA